MTAKIIAFTGTHGVGKTTAAYQLAADLKIKYPTRRIGILVDVEAGCPYPINQVSDERANEWIFFTRMSRELQLIPNHDLIITDRTVMDTVAYALAGGYRTLADQLFYIAERHMKHYQSIRFLTTRNFPYHYPDGVRDTDSGFRETIEGILMSFYQMAGLPDQERYTEI